MAILVYRRVPPKWMVYNNGKNNLRQNGLFGGGFCPLFLVQHPMFLKDLLSCMTRYDAKHGGRWQLPPRFLLRNDPKLLAPILEYLDQLGGLRVGKNQEFQIPKMEVSCPEPEIQLRLSLGVGKLPYISRIHTAYIGEDSSILGT